MRFLIQLVTGLVFFVVGALILMHFMPGSANMARAVGVPDAIVRLVARETPEASGPAGAGGGNRRNDLGPPVVVAEAAKVGVANDRLRAIGDGDAIRSVAITPLVAGQIAQVLVRAGQHVKSGDQIARLDDDVEKIALQKAKVDLQSAEDTLERNRDLKRIVSGADLQQAETAVETARLEVAQAELNLARRSVLSPVTGIAGIVNVTQGDYVTVSSPLVTIDDRSRLLVDFWVPERFAGQLKEGLPVSAKPIAEPGKSFPGRVADVDNRIDPASRTLHVRAEIPNRNDELRAGQSFEVLLSLGGEKWPSVNPLAVQWDSQGSYVWRLKDHKVERVAATIIERNPDEVLVDAALLPGDLIVTEGLQRLKNGGEVRLFGEKAEDDKIASAKGAGS